MSKIARVKFIRDKEPNIKALTASKKVLDGALYVATDTGTMWMGTSATSLMQIKDNINTNTTYNLTKEGSIITLSGSDGSTVSITDSNTIYSNATTSAAGLMSAADKSKLDSVATGANKTVVDASFVANSTNPVQSKIVKSALDGKSNTGHKHVKADITDFPTSMPASDVPAWAKADSKPSYTISEVSGNLPASRISGVIDAAHLPSYVDDVIEGYLNGGKFYTTKSSSGAYSGEIKAEAGKIYVDLSNNKTYRWSGSTYVVISETIALGTTHATAGYGDESRAAYNHSTSIGNPHKTTKADLGLSNVDNTADSAKSVKYATSAGSAATASSASSVPWTGVSGRPSSMPASDVYAWAKASSKPSYSWSEISSKPTFSTVATSGSYSDLSGKPTIPSVYNSTITIKQNGTTKGAFSLNQYLDTEIDLDGGSEYTLPAATTYTLGGVKIGSNISYNSYGTISLTKENVTNALGYTPPTSDTNTWRPEEVIISSTQPSASTCKLWIKI